jgi:large subunit ribosomal protein L25
LNAIPRALGRRAGAKKLRESGRIPAVIYGRQAAPQNLEIDSREMEELIHHSVSENLLVDLAVKENDPRPQRLALVQEVQHHPLTGKVLHVDFHEIAENEKVTVSIPVETVGEAEGVKTDGGVLEHVLFKIRVRGLAKDLPEFISVDVSHLKIGEAVKLGELKVPAGVDLIGDRQIPVIACAAPRTEEEEAAEAAEAASAVPGEVEMLKEKKEEGEAGAAPAKGAAAGAKGAAPAAKGAAAAPGAKAAPGAEAKPAAGAEKKPAAGKK